MQVIKKISRFVSNIDLLGRGNSNCSLFLLEYSEENMEERIIQLLELKFKDEGFEDLFFVDMNFNEANKKLEIFLDSDTQLTISQCARINRYLQKYIDEAGWLGEKYILDVSSPGVGKPLKFKRQYIKNIGRKIELKLNEVTGKREGKLVAVNEDTITIEEKERVEGKKKKVLVQNEIPLEEIKKAVIKISFK